MKKLILAVLLCTSFGALADSQTYCNPDGAGGQICNTYGSGDSDSGQSYTSPDGAGGSITNSYGEDGSTTQTFCSLDGAGGQICNSY
ncbi:TPA: hypothetical protein LR373_001080 [Enterobacter hormaechei]|uniref:hypothetical protein n=1 Tax=Enterobacter hormaechei TaxID=158836 RepID=UPI0010582640|nr:hypothetical protein [Enterobacter hormaechei]HBL5474301.1 hypothetical protein [Enterobacter hormaechei]